MLFIWSRIKYQIKVLQKRIKKILIPQKNEVKVEIINSISSEVLENYLTTERGQKAILNIISTWNKVII